MLCFSGVGVLDLEMGGQGVSRINPETVGQQDNVTTCGTDNTTITIYRSWTFRLVHYRVLTLLDRTLSVCSP